MARVETLVGQSPNTLQWNLAGLGRRIFEDAVVSAIQRDIAQQSSTIVCIATDHIGDKGRDLVIAANQPVLLCGIPLHPNRNGSLRAIVEIKSKEERLNERLDEKSYGRSITQLDDDCDYFVLVTNSSITPRTARQTTGLLASRGTDFIVVDESRLYIFLNSSPIGKRFLSRTARPEVIGATAFVAEAQIHRTQVDDASDLAVDLWLRNYSSQLLAVELTLRADEGWRVHPESLQQSIGPNHDLTIKLSAKGNASSDEEVVLAIRAGDAVEVLTRISARTLEFDFTTPLHGEQHHRAVAEIRDIIQRETPYEFINICGEAGTGKTRIITEALAATENRSRLVHRAVIDRAQPDRAIRELCFRIEKSLGSSLVDHSSQPNGAALLQNIIENLDHPFYSVVLIIEDLHHATEETIRAVKQVMVTARSADRAPLTLIVTGRDDFTFPNQAYFSLLDFITSNMPLPTVNTFKIKRLPRVSARALIKNLVEDIPEDAVSRILDLSESVPFCILQVIEHLLETGLAQLRRVNRIGIPNPFTFSDRTTLPDSMAEIYRQRLAALRTHHLGQHAWLLLRAATFYGQAIPQHLIFHLLGETADGSTQNLLLGRHFLARSFEGELEWAHENWLHIVRNALIVEKTQQETAAMILNNRFLREDFDGLPLAQLQSIAGRHEEACQRYGPAIAAARRVSNLSAAEIDPKYFSHLPYVFESLRRTGGSGNDLISTLIAHAYLGNHAVAGWTGIKAIRWAQEQTSLIGVEPELLEITRGRLKQFENHALMTIGQIGTAEKQLLELAMRVQLDERFRDVYDLQFDLYNRLQDMYRFKNHLRLAEDFGTLADLAAQKLGSASVVVSRFDTALIYHYVDTCRALRLHEEALKFARGKGVEQNVVCGTIGLLAVKLSLEWRHRAAVAAILDNLGDLLKVSIRHPYGPMIARCYLLIGVCNYLLAKRDKSRLALAQSYVDAGINAAINYGAGFDIWQLYNMQAILSIRRQESPRRIERQFNSAIDDLRASSLLSFGNLDLCFENIIVASNFVKFLNRSGHKAPLREFVREIKFYESSGLDLPSLVRRAIETVEKNGILFQERALDSVIYDDTTGYCIAAPC